MKRRVHAADRVVPPLKLQRFRLPEWSPLQGIDAYLAYWEAGKAWAAEHGMTLVEFLALMREIDSDAP